MLKFITIVTACVLLFSCLTSPSFWWNIKHHHWYNEAEKNKKSAKRFVAFQLYLAIILITSAVFSKHFEYCFISESVCLLFYLVVTGLWGYASFISMAVLPFLRTTNKITVLYAECLVKIAVYIFLIYTIR